MEAIIAAVISAVASILVAIINNRNKSSRQLSDGQAEDRDVSVSWWISVAVITIWVVVIPQIILDPDLLVINFFVIVPIATIICAFVTVPLPLLAASGVLAVHAVNTGIMSVSTIAGFSLGSVTDVLLLLGAFALNAVLAAMAARWTRSRKSVTKSSSPDNIPKGDSVTTSSDLTEQLASLAKLHSEGKLTDEEYESAKKKLLSE